MDDNIEKYIISQVRQIYEVMPDEYLKRNHLQYPFVSYVSLAATLYMSHNFLGAGLFVGRAYVSLTDFGPEKFDTRFLNHSLILLDFLKNDLLKNNRLTDDTVRKMLTEKTPPNSG